jgi:hypothetical protein
MKIEIKCPCCDGRGSEYPDSANYCGYCDCNEVVGLRKYLYWRFCETFLWRKK